MWQTPFCTGQVLYLHICMLGCIYACILYAAYIHTHRHTYSYIKTITTPKVTKRYGRSKRNLFGCCLNSEKDRSGLRIVWVEGHSTLHSRLPEAGKQFCRWTCYVFAWRLTFGCCRRSSTWLERQKRNQQQRIRRPPMFFIAVRIYTKIIMLIRA